MTKKVILLKIISWIIVILPILWLIAVNLFFRKDISLSEENTADYIVFVIIECINIIVLTCMSLKKFEVRKTMIIVCGIYLIISALIPVYRIDATFAPTGMNSHLMGLGLKRSYVDIYGINITNMES